MIRHLRHDEIDKHKWDNSISSSFNRLPVALSWYLDIVSPEWEALVSGDYKEIMPLTKRTKFGIPYICQPVLCSRLGVFSTVRENAFCIDDFIEAIPSRFRIADIVINSNNFVSGRITGRLIQKFYQYLKIDIPYDEIRKNFSKSNVKNIKRFTNKGKYEITSEVSCRDFFRNKMDSYIEKGLKLSKKDKLTYLKLLQELEKNDRLKVYFGLDDHKKVIGGICFLYLDFNIVTIEHFINNDGRKSGLISYLMDNFIRMNSGEKLTIDFMGSSLPGVRKFNSGFGSDESSYSLIRLNRLNKVLQKIKR